MSVSIVVGRRGSLDGGRTTLFLGYTVPSWTSSRTHLSTHLLLQRRERRVRVRASLLPLLPPL